ncbi:hypothetical protein DPEC_G00355720 [Dallia pectoralis]|uniref:Uncharacterized protein n=1 Tax=Dallia pectoralis TaxID=75939 RepID=A0ACC2EZL7_DALPE|nr:hypothetical protein DPEC_G00355720 [Dallia pectoralis]
MLARPAECFRARPNALLAGHQRGSSLTRWPSRSEPGWGEAFDSYLRSRWGREGCCWRVMKVAPHTGLLWLFLSQPIGGDGGYGLLRKPWSDSVSAVREEAELPITRVP